jgi:Tfp pilus assembly PilM family ATPase
MLARADEISSTEKLLSLIRGNRESIPSAPAKPVTAPGTLKDVILHSLSIQKPVTVGVDIAENEIRLIKVLLLSEDQYKLLDCRRIALPVGLKRDGGQFQRFLRETLLDFCQGDMRAAIWTTMSSVDVTTKYLKIPKVPKKQIANAVYWSYRREASINEDLEIFDHDVLGELVEDGVDRIQVLCYTAARRQIEDTRKLFARAGFSLTGISIVPFAIQNLFRAGWVKTEKHVCTLFIGKDWSRIAIYASANLILSRDVKAGLQSLVEAIVDHLQNSEPTFSSSPTLEDALPEENGATPGEKQAQQLLMRLVHGALNPADSSSGGPLGNDEVFSIILPALERIARQVERTIDHYRLQFTSEPVSKLFVSGEIGAQPRVLAFFQERIGIPIEIMDPFSKILPENGPGLVPRTLTERGAFIPVVGMALSTNGMTPNFLFTNKDRERRRNVQKLNGSIFSFAAMFMAICIGVYIWQTHWISQKKAQAVVLQNQVDRYMPRIDKNFITQLAAATMRHVRHVEILGQKYKSAAIIGEVCDKTPSSIRLYTLSIDLGSLSGSANSPKAVMVVEGLVTGERLQLETALAGFLAALRGSPMFKQPQVIKQAVELQGRQEVLRFTAQVELS